MDWIILKRNTTPGQARYVAPNGSTRSYVADANKAKRFPNSRAAEDECCGNEMAVRISDGD